MNLLFLSINPNLSLYFYQLFLSRNDSFSIIYYIFAAVKLELQTKITMNMRKFLFICLTTVNQW